MQQPGASADPAARKEPTNEAIRHLEFCHRWGLWQPGDQALHLASLHAGLGQMLADGGDLASAAGHFGRSIELYPDDAPTHYNLGVVSAAMGRIAEAIDQYRRAIALAPADADAHNNLGFLLMQANDLRLAQEHLEQAIALKPDFPAPHFNLGRLFEAQGKRTEALRCYTVATGLDARYAEVIDELKRSRSTSDNGAQEKEK